MKPFDTEEFFRAIDRRQARRFSAEPIPPTGFGDLTERSAQSPEAADLDRAHQSAPAWFADWEWNALMEQQ
jgi:hypothetical protein